MNNQDGILYILQGVIGLAFIIFLCTTIFWIISKLRGQRYKMFVNKHTQLPSETNKKDDPLPFGYKMGWLAVKTTNVNNIVKALDLKNIRVTNWETGISTVYEMDQAVFITPQIQGWYLIVSFEFAKLTDHFDQVKSLLSKLSKQFGEVQLFATHRVVEAHCWFKAVDGDIKRAFSYVGESGEVNLDEGVKTEVDKKIIEQQKKKNKYPYFTENDVMDVAKAWSVDPSSINKKTSTEGDCYLALH